MNYKLAVIPGDGIGPDVVEQTLLVLDKVGEKFGHTFQYHKVLAGGCAIDATGGCLPQETIDMCKASDAVLLGAVGGWKWDTLPEVDAAGELPNHHDVQAAGQNFRLQGGGVRQLFKEQGGAEVGK